MTATPRKVRGCGMVRSGQGPIRNAVPIYISITLEAAQFLQLFGVEHLASIEFLLRIYERIGHPVVHPEIEIAHDEYGRLESFGKIERVVPHRKTFFNTGWKQHDVLGIAMRAIDHRENVGLLRSCRQTCTRSHASDVEDYNGNFRVVCQADKFLHQRDSRSGSRCHGPSAGPAGTDGHADRS